MPSSLSSWRFLISRRWVLFFVAVLLLSWIAWLLGQWQFHRLEDRQARNEIVERMTSEDHAPFKNLLEQPDPWPKVAAMLS